MLRGLRRAPYPGDMPASSLDPALAGLLDVQAEDNHADALRHRLATLPERSALQAKQGEIDALTVRARELAAPRRELERQQKRLEDEVATLRAKADEADKALYGGKVTAMRELQALQEEVTLLRRRASELEDKVLDLMVELEPLSGDEAAIAAQMAEAEAAARVHTVALAEAEAAVAAELAVAVERRAAAAAGVEPSALAAYERNRQAFGGSAVVRLVGSRCEGCPLAMPAMEVDRIRKAPPGLATCDECGRLVLH